MNLLIISICVVYVSLPIVFLWGMEQISKQNSELDDDIKRANKTLKQSQTQN